jgi:ferredoxin
MREQEKGVQAIVVDRIRCDGFGMCAELLPELIELDDWGYPIVAAGAVPAMLVEHAQRAVAVCPLLALRLRPVRHARMTTTSEVRNPVAAPGG